MLAATQACFVSPYNLVEYLPLCFFGSLMLWIGFEIAKVCLCSAFAPFTFCLKGPTHRGDG